MGCVSEIKRSFVKLYWWIGREIWAQFNVSRSPNTYVISGTCFYASSDPINSVKAVKEDGYRISLQSHQVHPTVLQ